VGEERQSTPGLAFHLPNLLRRTMIRRSTRRSRAPPRAPPTDNVCGRASCFANYSRKSQTNRKCMINESRVTLFTRTAIREISRINNYRNYNDNNNTQNTNTNSCLVICKPFIDHQVNMLHVHRFDNHDYYYNRSEYLRFVVKTYNNRHPHNMQLEQDD
jgi:hypothetical protein